jgi:hypothetical protein
MADIYKFSDRMIDLGERLGDVADAARGKGNRKGKAVGRWLMLPAAGAGLYALGANGSFARQAKNVVSEVKSRASDLPEDLVGRVQQVASGTDNRRKTTAASGSQRRRKTSKTSNTK